MGNMAVTISRQFSKSSDKTELLAESDDLLKRSLDIWIEIGKPVGQAQTLTLLGSNASLRGEYEEATEKYLSARSLYEAAGNPVGVAEATGHLAIVARYSGKPELAKTLLRESIAKFTSIGIFEGPVLAFRKMLAELEQMNHKGDSQ